MSLGKGSSDWATRLNSESNLKSLGRSQLDKDHTTHYLWLL